MKIVKNIVERKKRYFLTEMNAFCTYLPSYKSQFRFLIFLTLMEIQISIGHALLLKFKFFGL